MKVTETHDIDEDGKGSLTVSLEDAEGNEVGATIFAGEPEDAVFYRDLNGAYSIVYLVKAAHEAGKRGEDFEYECIDENDKEAV